MKKKSLKTVSIGIAAYNEEKNIKKVLTDILNQNKNGWKLAEIIVFCDGCDDNTAALSRSIGNDLIKVYEDSKRRGKPYRLNQMFKQYKSDILVNVDADIFFKDNTVLDKLINKLLEDENVMLVSANSRPLTPSNFFEKAVYSTYRSYYVSRDRVNDGNTLFGCTGLCIAVGRMFSKKINIPDILTNEDDFLYFSCISLGYKFRLAKNALVYYKLPKNINDYIRQQYRSTPKYVDKLLKEKFGDLISEEYKKSRPSQLYFRTMIKAFLVNPVGFLFISILRIICSISVRFTYHKYDISLFTANSTK